jgi:hypothetical protein
MPSPKLYFRCPQGLHDRFIGHCLAQGLSPSEALKMAVEQWLGPIILELSPRPPADLEAILAEFQRQGVLTIADPSLE